MAGHAILAHDRIGQLILVRRCTQPRAEFVFNAGKIEMNRRLEVVDNLAVTTGAHFFTAVGSGIFDQTGMGFFRIGRSGITGMTELAGSLAVNPIIDTKAAST